MLHDGALVFTAVILCLLLKRVLEVFGKQRSSAQLRRTVAEFFAKGEWYEDEKKFWDSRQPECGRVSTRSYVSVKFSSGAFCMQDILEGCVSHDNLNWGDYSYRLSVELLSPTVIAVVGYRFYADSRRNVLAYPNKPEKRRIIVSLDMEINEFGMGSWPFWLVEETARKYSAAVNEPVTLKYRAVIH